MDSTPETAVHLQWGVKIPLRDGTRLSASLYLPNSNAEPAPCLFCLTPYTAQRNHARASYFATHGYAFLVIDVRGRGNSEGEFRPFIQEAEDGRDVVEWIAQQPFCNGKVAMFSGSYEGYSQWAVAKEFPAPLATIVPGMAAIPGFDFPMRNNVVISFIVQWLTYITDKTLQENIFADQKFWRAKFREWYESGRAFRELDAIVGNPSPIFQQWLSHPTQDAYWDEFMPTAERLARIDLPILTLTGSYDASQPGALRHYTEHLRHATPAAASRHYLVIGPWDHGSVLAPKSEMGGIKVGPAALMDVLGLHVEWYNWTMRAGPRPEFLKNKVAYYVMGAEKWRYADTLEAVTLRSDSLFLQSVVNPTDLLHSGALSPQGPGSGGPDYYVYDPADVTLAALEASVDPENRVDQRMMYAGIGTYLVYHSAPFAEDTEISGFFKLLLWLSIDQPDTDFRVAIYEIALDGSAIQLTVDWMRARYRQSLREQRLVEKDTPLRYNFENFPFISRQVKRGHRLRLTVGPINSVHMQKNYNSGGVVADECRRDARAVTVKLFHDSSHRSVLYVPVGQPEAI